MIHLSCVEDLKYIKCLRKDYSRKCAVAITENEGYSADQVNMVKDDKGDQPKREKE